MHFLQNDFEKILARLRMNIYNETTVFLYTRHALDKLKTREPRRLHITKRKIEHIAKTGNLVITRGETTTLVGPLDSHHSLCVVYKMEESKRKIITFFPAERGRYESKILH